MHRLAGLLIAALLLPVGIAAARTPVTPKRPAAFFFVKHGSFSIALDTKTATQITAGKPGGRLNQHQVSGVLVLCPARTPASPVTELHVGFRGAKLKLKTKHLRFAVSYTQKHARLVVLNTGATTVVSAKLTVTGTVATPKLIAGTVSVKASGCSLKLSEYKASFTGPLPF